MANSPLANSENFLKRIARQSDVLIAIAVVAVVILLIIPIPVGLLDFLIMVNFAVSLVIFLTVLYIKRAASFSVFPSLILLTTVFRLSINVASTRLILNEGQNFSGMFIQTFGDFLVGGNFVVGVIIFLILIAVQFLVITKGATRVSEVAARFTLDAMPGKQMSIDADLNAGIIDEKEAIRRRKEIREEADFYGAMDGASKFVQGDVRVGLLITAINIIGGLIIGTTRDNMSIQAAADVFMKFTVGDGLVSQIPSLMLTTATGIIVTRSVSEDSLGKDISNQLTLVPLSFYIVSALLFIFAWVPGLPTLLLIPVSIALAGLAYYIDRERKKLVKEKEKKDKDGSGSSAPETVVDLVNVEALELEIGFNLVPFVAPEQGGDLLERVKLIRKSLALDLGLVVPPIRIRDNMKLRPSDYVVKIKGVEGGKGSLRIKKLLAIPSSESVGDIEGEETVEPAFGTPARWISEEDREKAESQGYSVVDPPSIIATHLTEVIKSNASEILGRQEIKMLLDNLKEQYPAVVDETLKASNLGEIQKVLQNLLKEQVSIRNMISILETIADYSGKVANVDVLTEYVRQKLAKQISGSFSDEENRLYVFTLEPKLEQQLEGSLQETDHGYVSTLDPDTLNMIVEASAAQFASIKDKGIDLVVLTSAQVRSLYRHILERAIPSVNVLSYNEIVPGINVEQVGVISLDSVPATQ